MLKLSKIAWWRTTRILQFVVVLCTLGLLFFKPQRDWLIWIRKQKRKNEFLVVVKCRHRTWKWPIKNLTKTLFTWSGGPWSSGVSFFCFVSSRAWKLAKETYPTRPGPPTPCKQGLNAETSIMAVCHQTWHYWLINNNFFGCKGDVTRYDSRRRFLAQHSVAMLEQCCNYSRQCRRCVALKIIVANRLV